MKTISNHIRTFRLTMAAFPEHERFQIWTLIVCSVTLSVLFGVVAIMRNLP